MTPQEFNARARELGRRKAVRPATPEYLAGIDAQIDALAREYLAGRVGFPAIVATLEAVEASRRESAP